jgi:3-hydroxy-9,10-secoandrosta-1,3,5(10)-triene-9,17-dione monooxygenase
MQQNQNVPAHDEILARAASAAAALSAHAAASEKSRCLTEAAESAMRTAGLYRITAPLGHGGYEAGPRTLTESVTTLARAYPSAGWVAAVYLMHTWIAGMFPEQGQAEIFADGPDVRIAGGLAPQGVADPVEGGWRVSGRWQFGSGVMHADWYLAGASLTSSTKERPRQVHVFVPRREIAIDDTWYTMGLRGTGSHDVLLKDVFVPAHRAMSSGKLFRGESEFARRQRTNFYLIPVTSSLALILGAVMLGMARRALELFTEQMKPSTLRYTGDSRAEKAEVQMRLAEADAEVDAAGLIVRDVVERFEALMASGDDAGVALRARTKWQAAYAVQLCRRAAERLFAGAGARATMDSNELQRVYRDINQGSHHATIDPDGAAQIHGRVCLGIPPGSYLI